MSIEKDITELIPLLVQGKLDKNEEETVLAQIRQSVDLQREFDFWQGIYAIRRELPRYDFSSHPLPETLDRFAQRRIGLHSSEYSEIASHLEQCRTCTEDVQLLIEAVKQIPEERVKIAAQREVNMLRSLLGFSFSASKRLAPALVVLVAAVGLYALLRGTGDQNGTVRFTLLPQFEKRNVVDQSDNPELQFTLSQRAKQVTFAFSTDRLDVPDYRYSINLTPETGMPLSLSSGRLICKDTELRKQCELTITDIETLRQLKQGGNFSLTIKEEFPANVELIPTEYEYLFKVSVRE